MNNIQQAITDVEKILNGKAHQIKLAFCCFLANGHLLLEDLPGMGKTTLAAALAKVMGLDYNRVQFTSDMLPADILGATIFEKETGQFKFHKGPIFTQVLLADEINRTTPKTQSALLESMAERQVSIEGNTMQLPEPFFVIATQNPATQFGTFPLPESQLDRFLLRVELGYPDKKSERALLKGDVGREKLSEIKPLFDLNGLRGAQKQVKGVQVSDALLDYLQDLVEYTRTSQSLQYGVSPRGAVALLEASKSWALIHGRDYVVPEDVQQLVPSVFYHRIVHAADSPSEAAALIEIMLKEVPVS